MKLSLLIAGAVSLLLTSPTLADTNEGGVLRPAPLSSQSQDLAAPDWGVIRLHAVAVLADGTFATSRNRDSIGAKSVAKTGTGVYSVIFRNNRLHRDCFWTSTVADRDDATVPAGIVLIDALSGTNDGLFVRTRNLSGDAVDLPFIVTAICAN